MGRFDANYAQMFAHYLGQLEHEGDIVQTENGVTVRCTRCRERFSWEFRLSDALRGPELPSVPLCRGKPLSSGDRFEHTAPPEALRASRLARIARGAA